MKKRRHFSGCSKFMIKPKGNNVFPTEVEEFISSQLKSKANNVAVVGLEHDLYTEAIMAFVEKKEGEALTPRTFWTHAREWPDTKDPLMLNYWKKAPSPSIELQRQIILRCRLRGKKLSKS